MGRFNAWTCVITSIAFIFTLMLWVPPNLDAGEFPVLMLDKGRAVEAHRDAPDPAAATQAAVSLSRDDRIASTLDRIMSAQLAGPTPDESDAGLEGLFPAGCSLDGIGVEDGRAVVRLTVTEAFVTDVLDDLIHEAIVHLTVEWGQSIEGLEALSVVGRLPGGAEYFPLQEFLEPLPPVEPKPDEDSGLLKGDSRLAEIGPRTWGPGQPPSSANPQPSGALDGASIFLSPGHGWYYASALSRWATQRGNNNNIIEDLSNAEAVLQNLTHYLHNAGARVYTVRERDLNTNMVIVDNGGTGHSESGTWTTESSASAYNGAHRKATTVTGAPTATSTFTPTIPEDGLYAVYVWYRTALSGTTTTDAAITVNHSGGATTWTQNQTRDAFTWKYIGTFHFEAGTSGSVVITNSSGTAGNQVMADAVRFGGGMGDFADGGSVSGWPRWEESGKYFSGFMGFTYADGTVNAMPRYADWENESWETASIYLAWHTNAAASSSARGTDTFAYSSGGFGGTFNGITGGNVLRNYVHAEVVNDIQTGYDATWVDRGVTTANFGEINPSNNDEMPAALIEIGFHTSPVDTDAIEDPEFRRIASRAVYQGIVKFYNDFYSFSDDTLLPEPPTNLRVLNASGGDVTVAWNAPPFNTGNDLLGDAATGYRVYLSSNGKGFDNGQSVTGTSTTLDSLTEGQVYYVRVTATNSGGESFPTETLAVRVHGSAAPPALIVNGFDRLDGGINVIEDDPYSTADNHRGYLWLMNTFDYSIAHAESLDAADIDFDSCANEAVISGQVNLDNYHTVIWILGNESTGDSTLDSTEQSEVSGFLGQGGSLFLSGTEVGWDLDAQNNGRTFYENTLHANYVADDAGTYTASGAGGSIFSGISLQFDDGSEIYNARMPDVIAANAGSSLAMNYTGAGSGGAATQWSGGSPTANVVMLGFPFETILDEAGRDALMEAVTDFFGTASGGGGDTTPPAAPTGLGATPGDGTVALDWSDNGEGDLAGYNIHRATATGGPYTQLNGSLLTGSDYSDNSVTNDTTYYYVVTAEDTSANESGNSSEVSATPTGSGGGATEVIVDNDDGSPSYTETGTWATSGSTGYDGGTYRFATSGGAHTATFTPTLTANGNYEVFVFHRAGSNRPTAAQFTVTASTGDETEAVDQTINSLQWVSIGTFNLNASTAKVVLNAATSTPTAQATISDAVRFLPAGGPDPSTEIRAVWASRFQWPGSSQSQTEGNLDDIFDDMESGNFNTLFLQVRGNMDTLYPSPNETWSPIFGESDPGYDPLDYAVTEAHSRGLELHAYINTHTIFDNPTPPSNQNHVFYDHGNVNDANNRDWLLHDGSGNPVGYTEYHWMNPGVPEADTWVRDQVLYVIDNYDVDGVHFDRARMPAIGYGRNPIAVARWDDPGTGTANDGPGNPDKLGWDDFMRDAITRSLVNIYGEAWALDSSVAFSSAPLGLYDVSAYPGYPSGFNYGYPRGQDAKAWMSEGAMDFIVPQIYWDDGGSLPDFSDLYFDWQDAADSAGRYLVPGSNNSNGQAEVENHALISRANGGAGHALWQVASTNYSDWSDPGGPYENPSSFADFTWRQTEGVIIGHVFESDGTTPVTDAWVTRIGDSHTALSSADGFYTFLRLAPGSFTVTASHPDHGTAQASGISVTAGNATVVNLTLTDEAPAAPANLGATPGDGSVSLDWDDNTEPDLDGYNVHRATSTGGPYTQINGSLVMSSDYVDNTASNFTTYYYVVTAVDLGANESTNSNEASATPEDTTPPAAPTNLAANPGDGSISLNWDDNGEGDLDGYNVHRATATGGPYTQINGSLVSSSDYVDNSVTNGTTYYYVVTAVDDTPNANESGNSNEDSATPEDQTPPAAPTNLAATPGDGSVSLNWDDNGEGDLDGYNVHRATSTGGPYTQLNGSLLTSSDYVDNSAVNFTTYYYVVTAVDNSPNANESGNSNEDSATPEDVTPPAAPTNLSAQGADGSVSLDWDDNGEGDLDGYNVHRATATGGPYTQINGSLVSVSAYTDNTASNGTTYYYVVTAVDDTPNANESNISNEASATPQAVAQIRIEAEDYDTGGEGVGYHDTTSGNTGGQYRSDDVDIETSTQGGYNVGWIAAGEWLQFSGISGSGQSYDIDVSVASASSGGEFHIEVNGVNVTGRVTFAATGGWQTWATIDAGTLTLPSGSNTIRFVMDTAGFNVDWFELNARDTGDTLDLDTLTMAGYGTQDVDTNAWELLDSGQILRLTGNTWKRFTVNYTVTADTVIEFDYKADANEPEIGGIVFDNDDTLSETQTWKVFGTQAYGNQEFDNYAFGGNGWTHYVIPVGQTLTAGSYSYLVLANDQDAGSGSNSSYRDVRIYENPTIIVDNDGGSPGFTTTGSWSTSGSSGYNGGSYVWANTGQSHTATWTFTLPESGDWEVEVIYRASTNRATSVEYEIDTSSGTQTAFVDQTQNNLVWVSLGTYAMDSGSTTVTLDSSGSSGGAVVIADAVRITRVP